MKTKLLLTCMLLGSLSLTAHETKPKDPIHVVTMRMDVFYFRVDKALIGAEIQVFSADGVKLHNEIIGRRKVLIDFYYENVGTYTIQISKGDVKRDFSYIKKQPCPEPDAKSHAIVVAQGY